jgi:hypothetical protein
MPESLDAFKAFGLAHKLSPGETELLRHLYTAQGSLRIHPLLRDLLFVRYAHWRYAPPPPDLGKAIRTFACKANRKLAHKVEIKSLYGKGYFLERSSLDYIRNWLSQNPV